MQINRHDLIVLNTDGRAEALANAAQSAKTAPSDLAELSDSINGRNNPALPGIARRNDDCLVAPDCVAVGFSLPPAADGTHRRFASTVRRDGIREIITPFAVWRQAFTPRTAVLRFLRRQKAHCGADDTWGVWGSAALEIFTGLPFTHAGSDLDLIVRNFGDRQHSFLQATDKQAHEQALGIDIEILLKNGDTINAREYLSAAAELLVKGIRHVTLMSRAEVERLL